MAPKAAKKGAAAKKTAAAQGGDVQTWESGLANAPFDEENWKACVCLVVGQGPKDEELIRFLARAVQLPQRKLFTSLTREETEAKIREYGNPKVKKRDAFPQYYEVTEPARELLEAREEIPAELMGPIVKFMLLQIKEADQQRRKAEHIAAMPPKAAPKPAGKGKDKKTVEEPPPKPKTKLKRRDDVEPPKYINDEPKDGPQHYVLILGFHQPQLVGTLDAAGVHVANVIRLSATHTPVEEPSESDEEISEPSADEIAVREAMAAQAKLLDHFWAGLRQVLDNGGVNSRLHDVAHLEYAVPDSLIPYDPQDYESVMAVGSKIFEDVANLIYDCLDWRRQHQHYLDSVNFVRVPAVLSGQDIIQPAETVTAVSPRSKKPGRPPAPKKVPSSSPSLTTDVDMNHYNGLLENVPAEACSVPLILHCMLEQVVFTSEQPQAPDDSDAQTAPILDHHVVAQMLRGVLPQVDGEEEKRDLLQSLLTTLQNEDNKEMLKEQFDAEDMPIEHPSIIRHHDERALRFIGLTIPGLDPAQEEASMMMRSPAWKLINSVARRRSNTLCWMAIKQQLQRQCTDDEVSWPQVERFLHQSVFESMQLTGLNEDGVLGKDSRLLGMVQHTKKHPVNPWDNPLSFAKQKLRILRKKWRTFLDDGSRSTKKSGNHHAIELDLSDIQNCRRRSLSDWCYVEHYEASVFAQVLQSAFQQYRCLDTLRGSHNNVMYIFCHNPMSSQRSCKEFWNVAIHTDVKFRRYLEHVAGTITDWIEKEEMKRELLEKANTNPPSQCWPEEQEEPYITKTSLKAIKLEEERLKDEESKKGKKGGKEPAKKPAKSQPQAPPPPPPPTEDVKVPEAKKTKSNTAEGKSKRTSTDSTTSDQTLSSTEDDEDEGFTGFHMDGMLVHLSGCLHYLFTASGGHITIETISFVERSSMLKVAVRKDAHHFYTHINTARNEVKANSDSTPKKPPEISTCKRSFSALLDNGVRLSYTYKRPPEICKATVVASPEETEKAPQELAKEVDAEQTDDLKNDAEPAEEQRCESPLPLGPLNSLNLSLPNGLLVQFMREDEGRDMLVRLSFHAAGPQDPSFAKEASRTITSQGTVIRYMKDGSSEVLFADGTVSSSSDSGPVWVEEIEDVGTDEQNPEKQVTTPPQGFWTTTTPCGMCFSTVANTHEQSPDCTLLIYKTSDPATQEVMLSREDLVVMVQKPDGGMSVDHADGTRITTFYQGRPSSTADDVVNGCTGVDGQSPDESAAMNSKTHEVGSPAHKEKVLLVENEACATVSMYPERHMAEICLADGTIITGNYEGVYQVIPGSVGFLNIQSDGKCVYTSGRPKDGVPAYIMSHTDKVVCDITDLDGNYFQVLEDGQVTARVHPPSNTVRDEEEDDREKEMILREHCPRLFVVHEDGSGTELLSRHTAEELLYKANLDPNVALLKDPLPDTRGEYGITILKPSIESARSKWVHAKLDRDSIPPNRHNSIGHLSPGSEKPSSPLFGSTSGLSPRKFTVARVAIRSCPKILEIRELYQHSVLSKKLRNMVDMRLKEYIESLMVKAQWSSDVMLKDPRSEVEQAQAGVLLSQSLTEDVQEAGTIAERTTGDFGSLYSQSVHTPVELFDKLEDPKMTDSIRSAQVKQSQWPDILEQYRMELCEVKACVEALRKRFIVPFFHPENILLHQKPILSVQSSIESDDTEDTSRTDEEFNGMRTPQPSAPTPSPTPPRVPGSLPPSYSRIDGMTPPAASVSLPAPIIRTDTSRPLSSAQMNVIGEPRRVAVRLPPSIISSKPFSVPNDHFRSVEEPVRRRCRTISLCNASTIIRGFELRPSSVDFGLLKDGTSSAVTVVMKNIGVDTLRFHVKQPPISSGLRVKYHPGPVPAGLHVELDIELYAMCDAHADYADPARYITENIVIPTETNIIYLPVKATIVPATLYSFFLSGNLSLQCRRRSVARKQSRSLPITRECRQNLPSIQRPVTAAVIGHHKRTASL
ncbi:sperm-associated antigen 17 isoform X1 [Corythoichthys intestinalis]|uniref:sperm-associated antigen 17 isoform X1 n=1 Tax=Corythoichthys intestinalis TaxID=161448 RepID=UPI0025A53679|nr:sperm-associated antigen 17 isoform X1 [Corythoichthys intestinalis]